MTPFSVAKWISQSIQTPSLSAHSQFLALDDIICPLAITLDSRLGANITRNPSPFAHKNTLN